MTEKQEAQAAELGWHLDTSPETEMSNDIWYRNANTYALKREDDVLELLPDDEKTT